MAFINQFVGAFCALVHTGNLNNAMLIFGSTFVLVFALGFQSLNVNNGHYKAAFFTSFIIGGSNLVLYKTVPQAGTLEIAAYLFSAPLGIVASMVLHAKWMKKKSTDDKLPIPAFASLPKVPDKNGNVENYNPIPQPSPMRSNQWPRVKK